MYLTDEAMDEFAQWQHDSAWQYDGMDEEEIDRVFDCIHEHGEYVETGQQTVYGYMVGSVYECADCGEIVEV